jgi:hypothetical protein
VKAAWRISDAGIAPAGVRLEYQSGDALKPAWQTVSLDPAAQKSADNMLLGSAVWKPQTSSRAIDIRLVAQDRAGNIVADTRRVFLPRESRFTPKLPEWPPRWPAGTPETASAKPSVDPFTARELGDKARSEGRHPAADPEPALPDVQVNSPGSIPWRDEDDSPSEPPPRSPAGTPAAVPVAPPPPNPQDKLASDAAFRPETPLPRSPSSVEPPVADRIEAQPSSSGGRSPLIWPSDAARGEPEEQPPSFPSSAFEERPGAGAMTPIPHSPALPPIAPIDRSPGATAGHERAQLTSSKSFSLDYDIDSVGPSGVRAVELWVTTDGGHSWEKWGEDEDRRSPFEIQVESERTFGFRMVIVANNGLATRSPEPGDDADLWVTVDTTRPRVRWLQAGYGEGEHAGQLDLRWEADDEHLGPRPVTISFGDTPDGPFTTLAAGLPNTGQYYWTVDPRTPRQLYLRIEVRDEAGNIGSDQTPEPVSLEGLSPKGRIRAVIPSAQPALEGAFRSPLFR